MNQLEKLHRERIAKSDYTKIALICDLCLKLIPPNISVIVKNDLFFQLSKTTSASFDYQNRFHHYVFKEESFSSETLLSDALLEDIIGILAYKVSTKNIVPIEISREVEKDYGVFLDKNFNKHLGSLIKQRNYTNALIYSTYFLSNEIRVFTYREELGLWLFNSDTYDFKKINMLSELFLNIGEIEHALELYEIEDKIFSTSNSLVTLTQTSLNLNQVDKTKFLFDRLLEKEPYHPSVNDLRDGIERLENRKKLQSISKIDTKDINQLTGVEFENLLLDKFISLGFKVKSTPKTGDYGADLIIENNNGTKIIVQCKRFNSKVNLKAVQEVIGAVGHYSGDIGVVITNSLFFNSAINLAYSHDIELWDGDCLLKFLVGDLSFTQINK